MAQRRWIRLDTTWSRSEWICELAPAAQLCWPLLLCYVKAHGTGGRVKAMPAKLAAREWGVAVDDVEAMLNAASKDGALVVGGGNWVVSNWSQYQEDTTASRRSALFRDGELRRIIRQRDRDLCRYCGIRVNWSDRRGSGGGTYDHIDPHVGNTEENLVVSCRGCNSSKGKRTPAQAGMAIRPIADLNVSRSDPGFPPTETGTETTTQTGTETPSKLAAEAEVIDPSSAVPTADLEARASEIIRAANRGMKANPDIDTRSFRPIESSHGSRSNVVEWLQSGIPAELILETVENKSRAYQPSSRGRQINSMQYFDRLVREAWEVEQLGPSAPSGRADRRRGKIDDYEYDPTEEVPEWPK